MLTLAKTLRRLKNQSAGLLRSEATLWLEHFALSSVVRHEEVLNLVDEVLIQVVERLHIFLLAIALAKRGVSLALLRTPLEKPKRRADRTHHIPINHLVLWSVGHRVRL